MLGRLGRSGLVLLIVEDLEHSDPGTREFVSTLMRISRRLPVAMVIGYHSDEIGRGHPARRSRDALEDEPRS